MNDELFRTLCGEESAIESMAAIAEQLVLRLTESMKTVFTQNELGLFILFFTTQSLNLNIKYTS